MDRINVLEKVKCKPKKSIFFVETVSNHDVPLVNIIDVTHCIVEGGHLRIPHEFTTCRLPHQFLTMPDVTIRTVPITPDGYNLPASSCNKDPTVKERTFIAQNVVPHNYIINATVFILGLQVIPDLTVIHYNRSQKQSMVIYKDSEGSYHLSYHQSVLFREDRRVLPLEVATHSCNKSSFELSTDVVEMYLPSERWGYTYGAKPKHLDATQCAITTFFISCV